MATKKNRVTRRAAPKSVLGQALDTIEKRAAPEIAEVRKRAPGARQSLSNLASGAGERIRAGTRAAIDAARQTTGVSASTPAQVARSGLTANEGVRAVRDSVQAGIQRGQGAARGLATSAGQPAVSGLRPTPSPTAARVGQAIQSTAQAIPTSVGDAERLAGRGVRAALDAPQNARTAVGNTVDAVRGSADRILANAGVDRSAPSSAQPAGSVGDRVALQNAQRDADARVRAARAQVRAATPGSPSQVIDRTTEQARTLRNRAGEAARGAGARIDAAAQGVWDRFTRSPGTPSTASSASTEPRGPIRRALGLPGQVVGGAKSVVTAPFRTAAGIVRGGVQGAALEGGVELGQRAAVEDATPESVNQFLTSDAPGDRFDRAVFDALGSDTASAAPNPVATPEGRQAGFAAIQRRMSEAVQRGDTQEAQRLQRAADRISRTGPSGERLNEIDANLGNPALITRALAASPALRSGAFAVGDAINAVRPGTVDVDGARAASAPPGSRPPVVRGANTTGQQSASDPDSEIAANLARIQQRDQAIEGIQGRLARGQGTSPFGGGTPDGSEPGLPTGSGVIIGPDGRARVIDTGGRSSPPPRLSRQSAGGAQAPQFNRANFAAPAILAGSNRLARGQAGAASGGLPSLTRGQERAQGVLNDRRKLALDTAEFQSEQETELFNRATNEDPAVRRIALADIVPQAIQGDPAATRVGKASLGVRLSEIARDPSHTAALLGFGGQGTLNALSNMFNGSGDLSRARISDTGEIRAPRADGKEAVIGHTRFLDSNEETLLRHLTRTENR